MAGIPHDESFELLPSDTADLTEDTELAAALGTLTVDEEDVAVAPLGRGWAFDFAAGQFIRHGHAPAIVYAEDHLRMWVEKTLRTARFAHVMYSDDYGMEVVELIGQPVSAALISGWANAITDALTVHDRISAVEDFKFTFNPDEEALFVSFAVVVDEGTSITIDPTALGGA